MGGTFAQTFVLTLAVVGGAIAALVTIAKAPAFAFGASVLGMVTLKEVTTASIGIGAVCAALVATAAAFRLPVIRRPIQWLWRTLLADPVARWMKVVLREHTVEVVEPLIAPIRNDVAALKAQHHKDVATLEDQHDVIRTEVDAVLEAVEHPAT